MQAVKKLHGIILVHNESKKDQSMVLKKLISAVFSLGESKIRFRKQCLMKKRGSQIKNHKS